MKNAHVQRLAEISARCQKATKGPWKAKPLAHPEKCGGICPDYHNHDSNVGCWDEIVTTDSGYYGPSWDDAEFIAHAREDIPFLLAMIGTIPA